MRYKVFLTQDAYDDLNDIYQYIDQFDSEKNVEYVLSSITVTFSVLAELPERGHYPHQLKLLGIKNIEKFYLSLIELSIASSVNGFISIV